MLCGDSTQSTRLGPRVFSSSFLCFPNLHTLALDLPLLLARMFIDFLIENKVAVDLCQKLQKSQRFPTGFPENLVRLIFCQYGNPLLADNKNSSDSDPPLTKDKRNVGCTPWLCMGVPGDLDAKGFIPMCFGVGWVVKHLPPPGASYV